MKKLRPTLFTPVGVLLAVLAATSLTVITFAQTANPDSNPPAPDKVTEVAVAKLDDEVLVLSPFEVKATSEEDGYTTKETLSSARVAVNFLDMTQSVSVLNKTYINDFNIQDTRKLFENMPNVYSGSTDQAQRLWIRGAEVNTRYTDGVASHQIPASPLQFYDRVELVRGPSSSAFGVGQPGGVINFVTKVPTGRTGTDLEVGYGNHQNYLVNLDTEGRFAKSRIGSISYRVVGYWDQGKYQIQNESHDGAGALLSLRDDINSTTRVDVKLQYAATSFPNTDNPFILYTNQTAYSWVVALLGGGEGIPYLPNSKPLPVVPAGDINYMYKGDFAGGDLLSPGVNGLPENVGTNNDAVFRGSAVVEKTFLDRALTIRNTVTYEHADIDRTYITWTGGAYINPATGRPLTETQPIRPYPDKAYGPVSDIAISLFGNELTQATNAYMDNIDIDYHKKMLGVDWRFSVGYNIRHWEEFTPSLRNFDLTGPNGETIYRQINRPYTVNIFAKPTTNALSRENTADSSGYYANVSARFFRDMITVEAGDRRDTGGATSHNLKTNVFTRTPDADAKGAPRVAISVKPLKWLSLYAMKAEHNDPAQLRERYALFNPGLPAGSLAILNTRYNNFSNPFTYVPTGVLKEYGVKAELLNGDVVFSADFFQFTTSGGIVTNIITDRDPASPTYRGEVVENIVSSNYVSGGEVSLSGRVGKQFFFTAAYGITRGYNTPRTDGYTNPVTPPSTTNLHGKYNFNRYRGFDFYILGGVTRFGPYISTQILKITYDSPQYVWDLGAGVKWGNGRQSLELMQTNVGKDIPFISGQTSYASGSSEQLFLKYKVRF